MSHYEDYISKYQNDGTSHLTSKWLQLLDNKGNRNHTESEVKIIENINRDPTSLRDIVSSCSASHICLY